MLHDPSRINAARFSSLHRHRRQMGRQHQIIKGDQVIPDDPVEQRQLFIDLAAQVAKDLVGLFGRAGIGGGDDADEADQFGVEPGR